MSGARGALAPVNLQRLLAAKAQGLLGDGYMENYEPTLRDMLAESAANAGRSMGLGDILAQRMREEAAIGADFIPGVGAAIGGEEAGRDIGAGNYLAGGAGLAMSMIPGGNKVKKGIKAYHGSPHSFDKFSMDKIGTGEGAQAYGHGLYFAEAEDVARGYKQALERRNIDATWDGKPVEKWAPLVDEVTKQDWRVGKILDDFGRLGGNYDDFIRQQKDWYRGQPDMEAAIDKFEKRMSASHRPGSMYEVNINADPDAFLDWDKPLSEQSERVMGAADNILDPGWREDKTWSPVGESLIGPHRGAEGQRRADILRQAGIPGIKYLDAGSRYTPANLPNNPIANEARKFLDASGGDADAALKAFHASNPVERWATTERDEVRKVIEAAGRKATSNYVVFDDKLIEIVKKYGIAATLGAGLISQEMAAQMQEQGLGT